MRLRLVLVSVVFAGCAPAATSHTAASPDRIVGVDDRTGTSIRTHSDAGAAKVTLAASADEVFAAVAQSYAMLKVPVTYTDRGLGELGNKKFVMSRTFDGQSVSSYLNCGDDPMGGPNANANPVQVSIVTRARASGGTSTVLETMISGVTYKGGGSSGPIHCATTGELEEHIAEMVASRFPKTH